MSKNKQKKQKGFKFGRNIASLLIIIGGLAVLFLAISIPYSYITVGNKGNVTAFSSTKAPTGIEMTDVKRIKGKDFKDLDFDFYCSSYDIPGDTITFKMSFKWNDNTKNMYDKLINFEGESAQIIAYVSLQADWVGFEKYHTAKQKFSNVNEGGSLQSKTITISSSGIKNFPMKANTWPIPVTVETPTAYVYLTYQYQNTTEAGIKKGRKQYILEYTYDDYHTNETTGGKM